MARYRQKKKEKSRFIFHFILRKNFPLLPFENSSYVRFLLHSRIFPSISSKFICPYLLAIPLYFFSYSLWKMENRWNFISRAKGEFIA